MLLKNRSIKSKLMLVILLTSAVVLFITCSSYFIYGYYSFRNSTVYQMSLVGKIIAANSTAALAFSNTEDATEVLSSISSEPHMIGGVLFGPDGQVFTTYPDELDSSLYAGWPMEEGVELGSRYARGVYPVVQESRRLGTLFLISDLEAMYEGFRLFGAVAFAVMLLSLLVAYMLSRIMQKGISGPILHLAHTSRQVSEQTDYSLRAEKFDNDELGTLTDAFNKMLDRIEEQNQEITDFSQSLEKKVKERTIELEAAYKELEAFSYTVSHDLNAPLRHIDSYINMFLEEYVDQISGDGKRILESVRRNSKKMRQLIEDLLNFSQVSRKELKKSVFSMDELVRRICRTYERRDDKRQVEFRINNLPEVYADAATIRQVWENLVSNAYKYSRDRSPAIIGIDVEEQPEYYMFCIKDNGAGFDMNYYHDLFAPFQRLHTMSQFEGTGVGLAIVDRIVSRHGGRVWAESVVDKGSTFFFTLPKQQA